MSMSEPDARMAERFAADTRNDGQHRWPDVDEDRAIASREEAEDRQEFDVGEF